MIGLGPNGIFKGNIEIINVNPEVNLPFHETIERKGIGHPDTIADILSSLISKNYSKYTLDNCDNMILHHQIDKLMIIGGKTNLSWGGGYFVNPIKIIVAGRISKKYLGKDIPSDEIVEKTIKDYFKEFFPLVNVEKDLVIENNLTDYPGPGTIKESKGAIANMFSPVSKKAVKGYEKLVANDTSFCVSYSPYSKLENTILSLETHLNSITLKKKYLWLGSDIKIMAVKDKTKINITMCIPQISKYVHSLEEYKTNLDTISKEIIKFLKNNYNEDNINLSINTKDDYEKNNVYLTLTGSSLSGDIGMTGRGNRVNGLITANRPMSLEGASGKNPRYYSGFIYSIATRIMADRIYIITKKPCIVEIVSQNGGPLLEPWYITIITESKQHKLIRDIIKTELANLPIITKKFVDGNIKTC